MGVLCVEFFVLADGSLVVNEMAPRPHNSGHYSIEACDVSPVRTAGAYPGRPAADQPRLHSPAIMLNILGDLWPGDADTGAVCGEPDWAAVLALPGAHLHLYGKANPALGAQMGHLTLTGATVEQVRATALQAAAVLGIALF